MNRTKGGKKVQWTPSGFWIMKGVRAIRGCIVDGALIIRMALMNGNGGSGEGGKWKW